MAVGETQNRYYPKALEIGYSADAVLLSIAESIDDLYGIDLDAGPVPVIALLGKHAHSATLILGEACQLLYETSDFDLVLSFSVFEHLHAYEQALGEVARVLKPGGRFLLCMPAVNTFGFRAIGFKGIDDRQVVTPQAVASAFDRARLMLMRQTRLYPLPGVALYFNWLLEKVA